MLSIGKIAQGQHRYYERQVARGEDDYYSGRGEAPGEWTGAGARALGLTGRVSAEQFNALIAGHDPRDPAARLRSSEQDPKVAAFDLTFSAPKSVSVLFAIAPGHVSGQLVACHEEAVRAAVEYLQDTAVSVRRGKAGEHVERAGGLIAAAYRHRMSRALDPQLHTHVVAANLAQGPDGRFTALHSSQLYREAKTPHQTRPKKRPAPNSSRAPNNDLDARANTLESKREQLTERLAALPEPTHRWGREQDPNAVERAHLQTALQAIERELATTLTERARHERDLAANPTEARTERDALKHTLSKLTREQRTLEAQTPTDRHHERADAPEHDPALDLGLGLGL
jgi:TrwC relaxase